MTEYDVVIVGGSTTGSYFAHKMAENNFKVLVIEKDSRDSISPDYDVFHMGRDAMLRFGLPMPVPGDKDYCFEFDSGATLSAYGNYPKPSKNPVVGMHKRLYIQRMNDRAVEAGAQIEYGASFSAFVFDENSRISGVKYKKDGKEISVSCRLVADCSGIPSVARRALPDSYGVEKFALTPDDIFFVTLKYIKFAENKGRWLRNRTWLYYKTWLAPSTDENGAVLGVGSNFSFEYAEKIFNLFIKNVKLPAYTVEKTERGCTPYHRPPYSFVGDGFIAMGDAACLTKPFNGEGCTSSLVQAEIAVDVASRAMKNGAYPQKRDLWDINKLYVEAQGKAFASLLATLIGAVKHSISSNEFLFKHNIIFSDKLFSGGLGGGVAFALPDYIKIAAFTIVGLIIGKIKISDIKNIAEGALNGIKMGEVYSDYPPTPEGFEAWVSKADVLWKKVGSMSDWKLFG